MLKNQKNYWDEAIIFWDVLWQNFTDLAMISDELIDSFERNKPNEIVWKVTCPDYNNDYEDVKKTRTNYSLIRNNEYKWHKQIEMSCLTKKIV